MVIQMLLLKLINLKENIKWIIVWGGMIKIHENAMRMIKVREILKNGSNHRLESNTLEFPTHLLDV